MVFWYSNMRMFVHRFHQSRGGVNLDAGGDYNLLNIFFNVKVHTQFFQLGRGVGEHIVHNRVGSTFRMHISFLPHCLHCWCFHMVYHVGWGEG